MEEEMKIYKIIVAIFFLLYYNNFIFAAENIGAIVKGKVYSEEKQPLPSAHIYIPSIERGTVTNRDGEFVFNNIPLGKHRFVVSYVGYETIIQIIDINQSTVNLNFALKQTSIQTEPIVVTGNPYATNPLNSPQDISSLSGRDKIKNETTSLGKTVESIPGVYNLSTGSVAGKPLVRGHTGERVLILVDGVAQEYQQYGERHSPTVDVNNFDRIEIIKGAASLLYGSDALGGAVNLIPHPFHFTDLSNFNLGGNVNGSYYSNNNEYMSSLKLNSSNNSFSFYGNITRRKADNFNTPNVEPYSVTLKRGDPKFTGEIPYTNFEQLNGSFGVGYLSRIGIISIDYDGFNNKNNFLLPDGKPIGVQLINNIANASANIPFENFVFKPKFSYQRNNRQATKPGLNYKTLPDSAVVNLILNVYTTRFDLENISVLGLSGTSGIEIKHYDHQNVGKVPLQPTGYFTNYAIYSFEEWQKDKLTLNFGLRFDYRHQKFYGTKTNPLLKVDDVRSYSNLAGSFGASYKLTEYLTGAVNASRGFRTPSFFNLYVYGEHGGVFAFQIGNPNLKNETSTDISASLRFKNDWLKSINTFYFNRISNYIFLYNAPNHPLAPVGKPFVFAHDQADAQIIGAELSIEATVTDWLFLNMNYSSLKSKFLSGMWKNGELPLMPPSRFVVGTKISLPNFGIFKMPYISADAKFVSSKKAAGIYEPFGQFDDGIGPDIPFGVCSTTSYELVNVGFGFIINMMNTKAVFDFEITNLFNKVYRDFLDTYKGYALSPGRSVNLKINYMF